MALPREPRVELLIRTTKVEDGLTEDKEVVFKTCSATESLMQ